LLLLALLAPSLLAAQPSLAVVVSRRVEVSPQIAAKVTSALEEALAAEEVTGVVAAAEAKKRLAASGVQTSEACEADRVCLLGLLHVLKVDLLVAVDVGKVVDQYVLRVSAIDSAHAEPVAERATLVKLSKLGAVLPEETRAFARSLKQALASVPVAPEPAPAATPPPVIVVPAAAASPVSARNTGLAVAIAVAGAGGLTSLAAVIAGSVLKGQLYGSYSPNRPQSSLTLDQAQSLASQANGAFTVSLVSVLVAAFAVAAGVTLWLLG